TATQPMPMPAAVPMAPPVSPPMPTATTRAAPAALPPATTTSMAPPPARSTTANPSREASPGQNLAAAPAAKPAASAAESRVYAVNELPDTIQRELPKLSVGGSIYSDNAASRFLIINGQIFHENDKISSDLVLEQIKLKAAV